MPPDSDERRPEDRDPDVVHAMVVREPRRDEQGHRVERMSSTQRSWHYSYSAKAGGASGLVAGALLLAAVVAALVIGAVAITVVLWLALAVMLVGVVVALLRRVFGATPRR